MNWTNFKPSEYQEAIRNWLINGEGNAIVNAVAGSGKTTTLEWLAREPSVDNAIFLAFNKHIATELGARLEGTGMRASTIHALAFGALRSCREDISKWDVKPYKYSKLTREAITPFINPMIPNHANELQDNLNDLVHFSRVTLTDPKDQDALVAMGAEYGFVPFQQCMDVLPKTLEKGKKEADMWGVIDFTDQLWLCKEWNAWPWQYDWVFIDEAQDFNNLQIDFLGKVPSYDRINKVRTGRVLAVGDPAQAIYGFSGANSRSYSYMKAKFQAQEFPLSICYRCGSNILKIAQDMVPAIESAPDAIEGKVILAPEHGIPQMVQPDDLIIGRKNAPLIGWALHLISKKVYARMKGRDIGKMLTSILKKISKYDNFEFDKLNSLMNEYQRKEIQNLISKEADPSIIESFIDKMASLQVCVTEFDTPRQTASGVRMTDLERLDHLSKEIENLFTDKRPHVWLSSVHRAKGLEANRVMILRPLDMPIVWTNQLPWQYRQEINIQYVAVTRPKDHLIILHKEPGEDQALMRKYQDMGVTLTFWDADGNETDSIMNVYTSDDMKRKTALSAEVDGRMLDLSIEAMRTLQQSIEQEPVETNHKEVETEDAAGLTSEEEDIITRLQMSLFD